VDGVLGANTRNAIEAFQKDNGLAASRFIDKATWKQLMAFDEYGLIENEEINLFMIQAALKNAGYAVGEIDGKLGTKSMEMLKKFQEAEGLKPDGRIGARTLSSLARYLPLPEEKP
jgi:peptidoglycan hydrolase-like protein with peptidoglycan-binding domain